MIKRLLLFLLVIFCYQLTAQEYNFYLNRDYTYEIEQAIYSGNDDFHSSILPYTYNEIKQVIDYDSLMKSKHLPLTYETTFWRAFQNKLYNEHLITVDQSDFSFQLDPLMNFAVIHEIGSEKIDYINTRGFQLRGNIGDDVGFYTSFYENQASFPEYIDDFIRKNRVVTGQGKARGFGQDGYDYAMANGYISFSPSKHFNFQFGHGKNFWGNGYRSLILSDVSFNYPYLKFTVDFWKIKYVALYAQFMDLREEHNPQLGYRRKYGTLHYLSFDISERFELSLFDAIIWEAQDSAGNQRGFDVNYLNPVIFMRPVEFSIGSPDNALLGVNLSFMINRHNTIYGQIVLDEFKFEEVKNWDGWWGNKQAFQLGLKSFDVFQVDNLYFQTEFNYIRPFMYSHRIPIQAYGHYNQPLTHPQGANVMESVSFIKYHRNRWYFQNEFLYSIYGQNENEENYGKDIFLSYDSRVKDYNNYVGQGLRTNLLFNKFRISYLINPSYNLNLAASIIYRNEITSIRKTDDLIFMLSLRTSIDNFYWDF